MKNKYQITAILEQPELLVHLVEKLAGGMVSIFQKKDEKLPAGFEHFGISSAEVYLNGNMNFLDSDGEEIRMPFITSFHFTCIRTGDQSCRVTWSSSLS